MSYFRQNLDVGDQDINMYMNMVDFAIMIPSALPKCSEQQHSLSLTFQNPSLYVAFKLGQAGSRSTTYLACRPGPCPRGSDGHLGTFGLAGPAFESVQNHADPHGNIAQNTDLDALNPTILFIWPETAGKAGTKFGFHPTTLSVGPTTPRAGIIIPHSPWGCGGTYMIS